jgi:hypothetical protein
VKVPDGLIIDSGEDMVPWFFVTNAVAQQTVNFGGQFHDSAFIVLCCAREQPDSAVLQIDLPHFHV